MKTDSYCPFFAFNSAEIALRYRIRTMHDRISSFAPIVDKDSEILILGSVPGVRSLEKQQYYAHPQNKFWRIMFQLLNEDFTEDYSQRIAILNKHHIALWDVIDSCERKGSLDSEIRNEEANRVDELLNDHPNVRAVFCNGGKSYKNVQKMLGKNYRIPIFLLPSTSPLHTVSLEQKLESWKKITEYLDECNENIQPSDGKA
ncbi:MULTISPECIES: DNA-deoxyinosine glycosylase [Chryseobacterium]|uniref:Hypoxanthine-DNA glycosylase n=1 Tax=Chryseobacterium camelliae TaxID=1265445 RepID=A0ABU0TIC4_9FLAO|nr:MULTISPECIES: DNA-deoxyinosine glycosylase [Chryseobacterium]MDT3409331.1 hypoxanthine-DNA glycosylase [Pseudacidovorax intermedius]MDQ1096805.1 hypoxanthine-DNA glycosylase [Chryseobacterium camelliae]MDQ1100747.1 hypoxanthine-DNA glycosylase [Chryseobacterium sp. SORGH_AS_1048]MDR6088086.1 hypoxanthine-DNA glycosylase [Chryseobacterium sp. SORGH_AS_0909]MDR6132461.1 hypoxanthine-DNA glycosylase [Chryseobacterium sp. SORGH_AS_1175]